MQLQYLLTPYWYTWFIRFYEDSQLLGLPQSTFILLRVWSLHAIVNLSWDFNHLRWWNMSIQNTIGHSVSTFGTLLSFEVFEEVCN